MAEATAGAIHAVVGFTPRDLPGLGLWLDATDTATIHTTGGGGNVAQWDDKSGNGRHATAVGPGLNPTYSNNAVYFNGVDRYLNVDLDFLAGVSHAAFLVLQNNNYVNIYGAAQPQAGENSLHVGFLSDTSYCMNYWGNDWEPAITSHYKYGATNILNYFWISGETKQIYANGGYEGDSGTGTAGVVGTMAGGGRSGGGVVGQGFLDGMIQEIILYTGDSNVLEANRQKIEGYLASKYGLTSLLPDTNPYKYISFVYTPPCVYTVPFLGDLGDFPVYPDPIMWFVPEAGPFTPPSIPGLQLWLDAADLATFTLSGTGTVVDLWADKSGNGNNMAPMEGTPTYYDTSVVFSSGIWMESLNTILLSSDTTVYVVGKLVTNYISYMLAFSDINGGDFSIRYVNDVLGGTPLQAGNNDDFGNGQYRVNGVLNPAYTAEVYTERHFVGATNTSSNTGATKVSLSSAFSGDRYLQGGIYEVIVYATTPTTEQRQALEAYLSAKWGVALG